VTFKWQTKTEVSEVWKHASHIYNTSQKKKAKEQTHKPWHKLQKTCFIA